MLTPQEIAECNAQLRALKQHLEHAISLAEDAAKPVPLDQSLQGRVSRGDAMQQQAMAKAGLMRNRKHLAQVEKALLRIETDEYGVCEMCDEAIALGRLKIMPEAKQCICCQEKCE